MTRLAELGRRLLMLFRRRQLDRDLEEEVRLHLDLRADEHMDAGALPAAARRAPRGARPVRQRAVVARTERRHVALELV